MKNTRNSSLLKLDEETEKKILHQIENFRGGGNTLESALGAIIIGQYFGWRILKILHNPATYRSYEKILGIEFKAICPDITPSGRKKSIGYAITEKIGSFWAVVMGKHKVADKGVLSDPEEVERQVAKHLETHSGKEK